MNDQAIPTTNETDIQRELRLRRDRLNWLIVPESFPGYPAVLAELDMVPMDRLAEAARCVREISVLEKRQDATFNEGYRAGLAASTKGTLSHEDFCRLSRVFNSSANLRDAQDRRVNEWLKDQIEAALDRIGQVPAA